MLKIQLFKSQKPAVFKSIFSKSLWKLITVFIVNFIALQYSDVSDSVNGTKKEGNTLSYQQNVNPLSGGL